MKANFLLFTFLLFTFLVNAQTGIKPIANTNNNNFAKPILKDRYKIAVISPLYLDSFDLSKNLTNIPSYAVPGFDFYEGAKIAADTLNKLGNKLNIYIYDSKSKYLNMNTLISTDKLDSVDCIIGNVGGAELKTLAEFAKKHKINLVSAVSPADADQKNNPYFTILQPRLNTHIERIHKKIQTDFSAANVIFAHRDIASENNAFQYYKNDPYTQSINPVVEYVLPNEGIVEGYLLAKLNKTAENIIVLGILDAKSAYSNLKIISKLINDGYNIKVFGMPTWENIKALKDENEYGNLEIYYTASMMVDKITVPSIYIQSMYKSKFGGAMSDIVYKGFESVYFIANLLYKNGTPFNEFLNDNSHTFITPFRIMPVKENFKTNYYENKFLYLVKYKNGLMIYE